MMDHNQSKEVMKESTECFDKNNFDKIVDNLGEYSPLVFESGNLNHSEFFQKQGELNLRRGDMQGVKLFELAESLDPNNYNLLFKQGVALLKYGSKAKIKKYLMLATKKFKKSLKIKQNYLPALQMLGKTFFELGKSFSDYHFFIESKKNYELSLKISKDQDGVELSKTYWDFGKTMTEMARQSGEISDLFLAFDAFSNASKANDNLSEDFWIDFGHTAFKIGKQINDSKLFLKAIDYYKIAISKSSSNFKSWYYLAETLFNLYKLGNEEDHFHQANACLSNAAQFSPQTDYIWIMWAKLLLHSGKRLQDRKKLYSCIDKCNKAFSCSESSSEANIVYVEALSILGVYQERLDLIYEASNKAEENTSKFGKTVDTCYSHGIVLFALGKYHDNLDYYYQAIEKFQEGLSINRTSHKLWYYLAHTHLITAEIENDVSLYERAHKFYKKAISLKSNTIYCYECSYLLTKIFELTQEKGNLENSILLFEKSFGLQENILNIDPKWLVQYAYSLDLMGDIYNDDKFYIKAIEILQRVLVLHPNFKNVHYKLALTYSHLAELSEDPEMYQRSISHYKIAFKSDDENEQLVLDWSMCLINFSEIISSESDRKQLLQDAEYKLVQSAKLGNTESFYHLACLYSITEQYDKSIFFLQKAEKYSSLPSSANMLEDRWLNNLLERSGVKLEQILNLANDEQLG